MVAPEPEGELAVRQRDDAAREPAAGAIDTRQQPHGTQWRRRVPAEAGDDDATAIGRDSQVGRQRQNGHCQAEEACMGARVVGCGGPDGGNGWGRRW